jgi:MSHA pilin protein MshC
MKRSQAFTLIELILVILIISILAVSVVPKFFGASDLAHYTVRDQLMSLLRLSQLKAMNQLDTCNRVVITDQHIVIENNVANSTPGSPGICGIEAPADTQIMLDGVVISKSTGTTPNPFYITFDENGMSDCNCTINIVGTETIQLKIENQGYIHVL